MLVSMHNEWMLQCQSKQHVDAIPAHKPISTEVANMLETFSQKLDAKHALRLIWEEVRLRTGMLSSGVSMMAIIHGDVMNALDLWRGPSFAEPAQQSFTNQVHPPRTFQSQSPFSSALSSNHPAQETPSAFASPLPTLNMRKSPLAEYEPCERPSKCARLISELSDTASCIDTHKRPHTEDEDCEQASKRTRVKSEPSSCIVVDNTYHRPETSGCLYSYTPVPAKRKKGKASTTWDLN